MQLCPRNDDRDELSELVTYLMLFWASSICLLARIVKQLARAGTTSSFLLRVALDYIGPCLVGSWIYEGTCAPTLSHTAW